MGQTNLLLTDQENKDLMYGDKRIKFSCLDVKFINVMDS